MYKTNRSPFVLDNWHEKLKSEYLTIFVNNICNAKCNYCIMDYKEEIENDFEEMSIEVLINLLNKIKGSGIKHIRIVGKEPLLWSHLTEAIEIIKSKGYFITIISNGIKEIDLKVDSLCIHVDVEFIANNIDYWFDLSKKNNFRLNLNIVVNGDTDINTLKFYYKSILKYGYSCTIFCESPILFNKNSKLSINKAILLFRMLYGKGFKQISFEHPFPYCLIHKENLFFLNKYNIKFGGTCHAGTDFIIDYDGKSCYPCIGLLKKKINIEKEKFNNIGESFFPYTDKLRHNMPKQECYDCEWYKEKLCHAGCLVNRY